MVSIYIPRGRIFAGAYGLNMKCLPTNLHFEHLSFWGMIICGCMLWDLLGGGARLEEVGH